MDDPKVVQEFAQTKLALARDINPRADLVAKKPLYGEAAELLHRAIQLATDPVREAWCWFDLARTLAWLREPAAEIETAFLKALSLKPDEARFKQGYQQWQERERQGGSPSRRQ